MKSVIITKKSIDRQMGGQAITTHLRLLYLRSWEMIDDRNNLLCKYAIYEFMINMILGNLFDIHINHNSRLFGDFYCWIWNFSQIKIPTKLKQVEVYSSSYHRLKINALCLCTEDNGIEPVFTLRFLHGQR